jgi:hypothetical protein
MYSLTPVPLPEYEVFAKNHFEKAGKQIDDGVVRTIYERFDGTTWYLQKVLNQLFATQDHVSANDVDTAVIQIISYHQTSASSVQKSSQTLIGKQLLTHQQGVYVVYDKCDGINTATTTIVPRRRGGR